MVVDVEITEVVVAVIEYHEYAVAVVELAQVLSVFVVVKTFYVGIEPDLPSAECRASVTLQRDAVYGVLCKQVSL